MGVPPSFLHIQLQAMNTTDFKNLITRYLAGRTTAEEEEQLLKYYDYLQERNISWDEEKMGNADEVKKRLYDNALMEISQRENQKKPTVRNIFSSWKAAAAIVTIVSAGIFFYMKDRGLQVAKDINKVKPVQNDVPPGGNKAILTLADGSQIILDNAQDGTLTTQGNIAVSKSKDGQLVYKVGDTDQSAKSTQPVFNTISTPVGGQYQVILSDNTKVWLNASSSIRFPATFTGNQRTVEIDGEAYFEVAADKKRPFKVLSDGQVIEVLGTHFNVNAYRDESKVKTTLLEGSVKITSGVASNIIKPGQQAQLVRGKESFQVINIDPEEAVAWKNGLFMFDDEDIQSIMRKISRWYGVEVIYQDPDINEKFGGTVSRFENVSQVLKILEITGTIHFKIDPGDASGKGRRIIVMK